MMKKFLLPYIKYAGLAAISLGVLLFVLGFLFGWTTHNWFLIPCLLLILAGTITHVVVMKKESKY
jgi:hypothetical protein